jgi:cytochrome c oxidase cbb3-type subunit 2
VHLINPRDLVPESNMPAYPWLADAEIDATQTTAKMAGMQTLGVPYSDEDIAGAADVVAGKTELEALIAYLHHLGTAVKQQDM